MISASTLSLWFTASTFCSDKARQTNPGSITWDVRYPFRWRILGNLENRGSQYTLKWCQITLDHNFGYFETQGVDMAWTDFGCKNRTLLFAVPCLYLFYFYFQSIPYSHFIERRAILVRWKTIPRGVGNAPFVLFLNPFLAYTRASRKECHCVLLKKSRTSGRRRVFSSLKMDPTWPPGPRSSHFSS